MTKTLTVYTVKVYEGAEVIESWTSDNFKKLVKYARKAYPFNKITASAKVVRITIDDMKLYELAWIDGDVTLISEEDLT